MTKILDCTLRDGGYHNNWDFPIEIVNEYLESMSKSSVDIVEIGFRTLINKSYKGPFAFSTDNFLSQINIPKNLKISVMVNASDFFSSNLTITDHVNALFPKDVSKSKVNMVRIACHLNEFIETLPVSDILKKKGFEIGFNIMQFSEIDETLIQKFCKNAKKFPIDILYFADSLGTLSPNDINKFVKIIKYNWNKKIGVHTHNNLGLALLNSIEAINEGVEYIDCTVTGMGRGPGNAKTEELLYETEKIRGKKFNYFSLSNIISKYFKPLQKKLEWGDNFFYYLAGKKKIHPTYIQEILNNPSFSNNDVLAFIDYLSNIDAIKYKYNSLEDILGSYFKKTPKNNKEIKLPKNEKVLIIGNGDSILNYKNIIEEYILKNKIYTISLNTHSKIVSEKINLRAACHPMRIISDFDKYEKLKQTLVLPFSMLKKIDQQNLKHNFIEDYAIKFQRGILDGRKNFAIIPNFNVLGYALAICLRMGCKNIELVGFDGFDINDFRHKEVQEIIDIFEKNYSDVNLVSLTPSKYVIKNKSIFAYN